MKITIKDIFQFRDYILQGVKVMHKFYYITGAMVLVLGGLGIYSSRAGNKMMSNPDEVVVIEETVYSVSPKQKNIPVNNNSMNVNSKGGFVPLPEDAGVEVAPVPMQNNMPNPSLAQEPVKEIMADETVVKTNQ